MEQQKCTFSTFWRGYKAWLGGRRAMTAQDAWAEVDLGKANRAMQKGAAGVVLLFVVAMLSVAMAEHGNAAQGLSLLVGLAIAGLLWGARAGAQRLRRFAAEMCALGRQLESE